MFLIKFYESVSSLKKKGKNQGLYVMVKLLYKIIQLKLWGFSTAVMLLTT